MSAMRVEHTTIRLTTLAQQRVGQGVSAGGVVVDATAGNGYDTLFLRQCVGAQGTVYSFDVQAQALQATCARLQEHYAALPENVILLEQCHSTLSCVLNAHGVDSVQAVMFNLGYLPGGDHAITTSVDTTFRAVADAASRLAPGGLMSVMVYTGQSGGAEELAAMEALASNMQRDTCSSLGWERIESSHAPDRAPKLFLATRAS